MAESNKPNHSAWWKESSVYQIWPASFKDSNNDGILKNMGIDIVWLCPSYKSPQVDMGYDIADYYSIADEYAISMSGLSSHAALRDNEYRDWYIWRPPRYDAQGNRQPPNNWISHFQRSAWQFDEHTGEYYLHLYAIEQPDLNWEHPPVRKAVHDIVRFWVNKGCDGFRMDVINFISKDQTFPDAEVTDERRGWQWGDKFYANGPRLHEYLQDIGKILKEYDAFSVGEMPFVKDEREVLRAVQFDRNEIKMIFNFEHVDIDHGPHAGKTPVMEQDWPRIPFEWSRTPLPASLPTTQNEAAGFVMPIPTEGYRSPE
ncbi:alpha-glucosidase [Lipomyces tetrasporus]